MSAIGALSYLVRNRKVIAGALRQHAKNQLQVRLLGNRIIDPLAVVFYITHRCNLDCYFCTEKNPQTTSEELPTDETIALLSIIRRHARTLYVTGGEPLVRKDLPEVLRAAKEGLRFNVLLSTNGVLLDQRPEVLSYVNSLVVSLDSLHEERFERVVRGRAGTTRRVIDNLLTYGSQARAVGKAVTVNCVISEETFDDVYGVMDFCKENDFIFSVCSALINHHPQLHFLHSPRYLALVKEIVERKRSNAQAINGTPELLEHLLTFKEFRCYPTTFARVYPNGDVFYPCVPLKNLGGNLLQTPSLRKIYRRARKAYGEIPHCSGRCHLYANVLSHYYVHEFWNLAREYRP